jgi:hypothetical protein
VAEVEEARSSSMAARSLRLDAAQTSPVVMEPVSGMRRQAPCLLPRHGAPTRRRWRGPHLLSSRALLGALAGFFSRDSRRGAGALADRAAAASGSTAVTCLEDSAGGGSKGATTKSSRWQLHGDSEARRDLLPPLRRQRAGWLPPLRRPLRWWPGRGRRSRGGLSLLRPSSAPPRGAPRWRRHRRTELHGEAAPATASTGAANLPSLPFPSKRGRERGG